MNTVKAWIEEVTIPTYEIGEPEKNPVFLEKRVYQGSSGAVYPYPVIEKIQNEKIDKIWKAIYLENDFIKIMILPELGGRVQMAWDKIKQRHFVYYNQVIKPALVGLAGPWISGGIEFNWPQHHRPNTYGPVDYYIEENKDTSVTVWCSEIERMSRTQGIAGFTLYPDKAYMEIKVKLYNRTPHAQTFLWWANPAVKVNNHYQSVFPPDVNAVFDHGKRDVSGFPIAKGTYYKVDYSVGVDISKYKNIPVPTSYMAIKSDYNFIGCYENDSHGGMLHVANHHISPGKKQWTWGNGDFGYAWDRNLTDEDGPYIELMCGVYTDNQPDFSWIMPYEEKTFSQYFMPYRNLGMVKNASKDLLLNMELFPQKIKIGIFATSQLNDAEIVLTCNKEILFTERKDLSPHIVYEKTITIENITKHEDYEVSVKNNKGRVMLSWKPEKKKSQTIPEAAKPAKSPKEIKHIEQLYLQGLHLEQYRHATFSAADYYTEALLRDPGDVRCNNAMGLLLMKKGDFYTAENHFRTAITTLTERNPNPYDGEPYFNLGLSLRFQQKEDKAFEAFYKAIWNDAWQASGYFQLAQIATKKQDWEEALELIDKSLLKQWHNHKARHLKTALLRETHRYIEADKLIEESLSIDAFNFGVKYEQYLMHEKEEDLTQLKKLMRGNIHNYIEIALDYAWAGIFKQAISFLQVGIDEQKNDIYPMALYYLGWFHAQQGDNKTAIQYYRMGEQANPGTCFPSQLESLLALLNASDLLNSSSKAPYYSGNFYYQNRQYAQAIQNWELSIQNNPDFPTAHRNLSLAYYNKTRKKEKALKHLERAFELDNNDARIFMELDALYKRMNKTYDFRLKTMDKNPDLVDFRDDVYLEKISLLNFTGRHEQAYTNIMKRQFHPWEGGEGKVTGQYILSLTELAKAEILNHNYELAIEKLNQAKTYPHNLGEGKLYGARENDLDYWLGICYEKLGNTTQANACFELATMGNSTPSIAMFYNDQQPDKIFYQALSYKKLENIKETEQCFNTLIQYGEEHINDNIKIDYFAVSLPDLMIWDDDLNHRNKLQCKYLMGLGYLGKENISEAGSLFKEILKNDLYHSGAFLHLKIIENDYI